MVKYFNRNKNLIFLTVGHKLKYCFYFSNSMIYFSSQNYQNSAAQRSATKCDQKSSNKYYYKYPVFHMFPVLALE